MLGKGSSPERYLSRDQFAADVALVFANCRRYNRPDTEFVACANKLEPFFKARMRALALAQALVRPAGPPSAVATSAAARPASSAEEAASAPRE